jgi:uncharacterized protein with PIN domain
MPPVGFKTASVVLLLDSGLLPYKHALTGSGEPGSVLSIEVPLLEAVAHVFTGTRAGAMATISAAAAAAAAATAAAAAAAAAAHDADSVVLPAQAEPGIGDLRFLAPHTLWRLVRWLRCAGIDCASTEPGVSVQAQIARARAEGRAVITLSQKLALACGSSVPCHVLRSNSLRAQFADLLVSFGIRLAADSFMQRCTKCNGLFCSISPENVAVHSQFAGVARVPAAKQFWECTGCAQVCLGAVKWCFFPFHTANLIAYRIGGLL